MRFKQFITEIQTKPFTSDISVEDAFEWIKDHSSQFAKNKKFLFRGMDLNGKNAQIGDSTKFKRKSKSTENYYTLLMDSSPEWEKFPKRSSSFICSSTTMTSGLYGGSGGLFAVFPEDAEKLGVCPTYDLWQSFKKTISPLQLTSIKHFNEFVSEVANTLRIQLNQDDPKVFREQLHNITLSSLKSIRKHLSNDEVSIFAKYARFGKSLVNVIQLMVSQKINTLEQLFDYLLNPTINHFELSTPALWADYKNGDYEVWFSGKAVFIPVRWLNIGTPFAKLFEAEFGPI